MLKINFDHYVKLLKKCMETSLSFLEPNVGADLMKIFLRHYGLASDSGYGRRFMYFSYMGATLVYLVLLIMYLLKYATGLVSFAIAGRYIGLSVVCLSLMIAVLSNLENFDEIYAIIRKDFWGLDCAGLAQKKQLQTKGLYLMLFPVIFYGGLAFVIFYATVSVLTGHKHLLLSIFSHLDSPYYELSSLFICMTSLITFYYMFGLDILYLYICWGMYAQFVLLGALFQTFIDDLKSSETLFDDNKDMEKRLLKRFVEHHNVVVRVCRIYKKTLWFVTTALWTTCIMCIVYDAVLLSLVPLESWLYIIPSYCMVYLQYHLPTMVYTESKALSNAVYCSHWYCLRNASFKKSLVILMARLQRPESFTFSGFDKIHVKTFLRMLQFGYSIFKVFVLTIKK